MSSLDIFHPHRHQCGLEINMGRLRETLALPVSEQRHPVLMNSIYLWSCYMSRPEPLCQHDDHYLARALEALADALRIGEKIIDVIQASCLLSVYFLSNGRFLEGSYHASAAAAMVVQCGMHGGIAREASLMEPMDGFNLRAPKDTIEEGERISAFWQVFNLDRCWSVILRKPPVIPDGLNAWNSINAPWPQHMAEYEAVSIDFLLMFSKFSLLNTVQRLLGPNRRWTQFPNHPEFSRRRRHWRILNAGIASQSFRPIRSCRSTVHELGSEYVYFVASFDNSAHRLF